MAMINSKVEMFGVFGKVVGKKYVEAKAESIFDGKSRPAQPESFNLVVIFGGKKFTPENGFVNGNMAEVEVTKDIYDKTTYNSDVEVDYQGSTVNNRMYIKVTALAVTRVEKAVKTA